MATHALAPADFARLKTLDTCSASNAIERLSARPRNEGVVHGTARCLFPQLPPMLGYAVTGTVQSSEQPMSGGWYYDRIDGILEGLRWLGVEWDEGPFFQSQRLELYRAAAQQLLAVIDYRRLAGRQRLYRLAEL